MIAMAHITCEVWPDLLDDFCTASGKSYSSGLRMRLTFTAMSSLATKLLILYPHHYMIKAESHGFSSHTNFKPGLL